MIYLAPEETAIQATPGLRDRSFNPAQQSEGEIAQFSGPKHDRPSGRDKSANDHSLTLASGTLPGYAFRISLDLYLMLRRRAVRASPTLPA